MFFVRLVVLFLVREFSAKIIIHVPQEVRYTLFLGANPID